MCRKCIEETAINRAAGGGERGSERPPPAEPGTPGEPRKYLLLRKSTFRDEGKSCFSPVGT